MGEHALGSLVGQDAKVGRCEYRPNGGHHVSDAYIASRLTNELTGADLATDRDAPTFIVILGLLNHAHGIGPRRNRSTGHDACRRPRGQVLIQDLPGHDGADNSEADGRATGVGGADRVTVHGGVRERGDRLGRHDGFADDAVQGVVESECPWLQGEALVYDELLGFPKWDHGRGPTTEWLQP